ncbi:MAG: sporulation protein YtxC [Tissierellia bacterium]|nr:sporulation protein YtxC [Tissierellia bacterium]MDD4779762.1 sporulation protein YtxC [Tissierellia bacterium]
MELLSLEISKNENPVIINNIEIITNIDESDINIEIITKSEGNYRIKYTTENILSKRKSIDKIVSCITKLLIEHTKSESSIYLKENYFYFDDEEFEEIRVTIEDEICNDLKIQLIIKNKLNEVIENSDMININGFIKFRLKFINLYIIQIVEKSIDNYLMKKEYLDFMNIIKYLTESEEKDYDLINILYKNKKLQLYDTNMQKITSIGNNENIEVAQELDGKIFNYDESIINILLSVSPKKIKLHINNIGEDDVVIKNTVEIINKIFSERIELCHGCKYCALI